METAPEKYDVIWETNFNRAKLTTAIPNRLQELQDALTSRQDGLEDWYYGLVIKILLSVNRARIDLLKTMQEETVSGAAWNARNLLELWVWLKYCSASRENAFHNSTRTSDSMLYWTLNGR